MIAVLTVSKLDVSTLQLSESKTPNPALGRGNKTGAKREEDDLMALRREPTPGLSLRVSETSPQRWCHSGFVLYWIGQGLVCV